MVSIKDKISEIQKFINRDIWKAESEGLSKTRRRSYGILKILIISVKGFIEDGCSVRASALTFFTLLSVVPIIALAFAIAKGFGLEELVERVIKDTFQAQPDLAGYLISFSSSMLENTKGGLIAGIGVVMLLYSVFKLLSNIEEAFNFMWNIRVGRPLLRKVTDYVTIMIFTPILLIISSSATFFLTSQLDNMFSSLFSPFLNVIIKILPWVLMSVVFTILYLIMPNTRVEIMPSLISGVVTGCIFQIWQWIFVTFQMGAAEYGAIYGSFAALPLFLVWLQTSWIIVLVGCELTYSIQNVNNYATEHYAGSISMKLQKRVALLIMTKIIDRFQNDKKPLDSVQWSEELKISQKLFVYITGRLQEVGLLAEIKDENKSNPVFIPAADISKISVNTVCERLESLGKDKDFPIEISGDFKKIDEICRNTEAEFSSRLDVVLLKNYDK